MSTGALVPWFASVAPRVLLVFGVGFLVSNIITTIEIVRYHRRKAAALLVWPRPRPRYYWANVLLGVILGLLIVAEILLRRPMYSLFGEAMMFVYYSALYPRRVRIPRGFYHDGVWSDSRFMPWSTISGVSW